VKTSCRHLQRVVVTLKPSIADANLTKDVLQPELESTEEEAVSLYGGEAVLAEVEAGDEQRCATDEHVLSLGHVHVAGAVETAQRHAVQLHVTHVNTVCRRRRRTTSTQTHSVTRVHCSQPRATLRLRRDTTALII